MAAAGARGAHGLPLHSPETHARFRGKVELVGRFDIKCLVPSVHIADGTVDAEFRRAMRVGEHALARGLLMRLVAPDLAITHEQALIAGKTVQHGGFFAL